ncbi:glycosyltransferase [Desulfobulbus rhabdoformis]|uniref:glycosyltransferase n=1 Tax=Desulfobulbus rhabdoformis TaxID=34032 RepID=UPI00196422E5|nr:glycosyltransferase [Desulfobulbus rhabdoformis]MBM9616711.1 glycosyltransferase [Desulfobulbus rhabdoformis]
MKQFSFPLVTVIIPCFNREKYIVETIQSVLVQTWPNIELIVVDDGCTDGSRKLMESFGSALTILDHPGRVNRGQSAAVNLGLVHCRGVYVAILDSDDLFKPEKITMQVNFLEQHPEIGLVYSNGLYINDAGEELFLRYGAGHHPPKDSSQVLLDCCFNVPSNALVRRSLYEQIGYLDETLRAAQDHDLGIRLAEVAAIEYLDECLWCYRRHDGSISNTTAKLRWQNGFKILTAACKRYPYPAKIRRKRRAVLHFRMGQCFLQEKQFVHAAYHLAMAGLLDPQRALGVLMGNEKAGSPN